MALVMSGVTQHTEQAILTLPPFLFTSDQYYLTFDLVVNYHGLGSISLYLELVDGGFDYLQWSQTYFQHNEWNHYQILIRSQAEVIGKHVKMYFDVNEQMNEGVPSDVILVLDNIQLRDELVQADKGK